MIDVPKFIQCSNSALQNEFSTTRTSLVKFLHKLSTHNKKQSIRVEITMGLAFTH